MNSKDSLLPSGMPSENGAVERAIVPDEKEIEKTARKVIAERDSRIEQAEIRTEQAEARTELAKTRIEQAEVRIERAETRTEQAEVRTEQAETRTEQAEVRTEQAETRTEQAKTRTEAAEARTEQAETQSEQAIRASELRYRRLFETAQDGILILDAGTGQVMDANPFMKDLLGYSQEEFLGKKLWEIGPFKGEAASRIAFAELQRKDRLRYEGLPLETKNGLRVEVEFISTAYFVDEKRLIQCNIRDITERKRAEQRLTLLNTCISNLNDIVMITEADDLKEPGPRTIFVNEAFERITGYAAGEIMGRSPRFLQGEKTDRRVMAEIHRALELKQPIRRQVINYKKDGTESWMDIDIIPIFDAAAKCTHFAAIERDITEEKKTEEKLLWNAAFFEAQVNSALDGILVVDREGNKIVQNQRMVDLWSIPQEFADQTDDRRQFEWVTNQVKNPEVFADKVAYLRAHPDEISQDEVELINGNVYDRFSAPVRGKDGKDYGRIWAFHDITERKRSEAQIVEQAAFLDEARDAILVRDLEGKILFWNRGAERMYGWTRLEVSGPDPVLLPATNLKKYEEITRLTISHGEWQGEIQHRTKGGQEIMVEARWTLIRDKKGQPKSVLSIDTDVTESKKIEAQFMRAQRMESIGTLAGGIAHDLNNILAPIMMSIDILKSTSTDPQADKILDTIEVSAKRGADIVRQVLSFARGLEGQRIEVQPKHLLKDLENIIKDTFPKDIRLEFAIPSETWTILGDPTQVQQILLNLCVNARDAMPNGGVLSIGIENCVLDAHYVAMPFEAKPGRFVNINVTDTGTGMTAELIDKIFEPFFTTKELNKGTGLGLSTVMAIVKSHEGLINVYSELGKGTTFRVYLPATDVCGKEDLALLEEVSLPRGNGETVLLVDDEASILIVTGQTLQAFGYRVLTASNGASAVAVYAEHKNEIAVVLTDMMMPVMDGPAMIHALTTINPAVKIVAASGLSANGSAAKVSGVGVKQFLTKPYTAGALLKAMRIVLDEV